MSLKARRVVIELSLAILRDACEQPERPDREDAGLRLALRCLMGAGVDKAALSAFWEAVSAEVDIGRRHGVERAYEAVRCAVRVTGPGEN